MAKAKAALLPAVWQVPQIFRDRLGNEAGRQRVMQAEGHLLLILHAPPGFEDDQRVGRFFWRSPDGTWHSDALGSGPQSIAKLLDEYEKLISGLEVREDQARTADDYFTVIQAIAPLHRAAQNMHRTLQAAREACRDDRGLIVFRDRAYATERMAELLYSGAKNALDFAMARRAEEQAKASHDMALSAHRLNVLAAFFFPIATLTAIFGVNLPHGLERYNPPIPFFALLAVGLISGFILKAFVAPRR